MKYDSTVVKAVPPPRWQDLVRPYQTSETVKSVWQMVNTLLPLAACYYAMYLSLDRYWLTLLLALPTAGLTVRTFIIQHDCGHGSFFKSSRANDLVGSFCGFLTLIPYHQWRHEHSIHHATSGDLDRRGVGDVNTLTVREYLALPRRKRIEYAIYRHPLIMLLIGPTYIFGICSRFVGMHSGPRERRSVYLTNFMLLAQLLGWSYLIGFTTFISLWLPGFLISGAAGIWLFYVQHQYETTYWHRSGDWDYATAAIQGSSLYHLPAILHWFTGNIAFHHVHHLSPKIPNYKLQRCHEENPFFQSVRSLTLRESLRSASLRLWDEEHGCMVGFGDLKARSAE